MFNTEAITHIEIEEDRADEDHEANHTYENQIDEYQTNGKQTDSV